jgi:hypothetical protein
MLESILIKTEEFWEIPEAVVRIKMDPTPQGLVRMRIKIDYWPGIIINTTTGLQQINNILTSSRTLFRIAEEKNEILPYA